MNKEIKMEFPKYAFGDNAETYTKTVIVKDYKYSAGDTAPNNEKALNESKPLCTECGKALGKNPLYFEVNTSWEIIVPGSDDKNSQGCFPIGSTCANKFAPGLLIKMGA